MRVTELIQKAFGEARSAPLPSGYNRQRLHQKRSEAWVKALARHLQQTEYPRERFRVFSKYDDTNQEDFGLNELLFDVCVCEVGRAPSAKGTKQIAYVKRGIWQVESEFAKDTRAAVLDFSKLVLGSAPNKLFIGPALKGKEAEGFTRALLPVAQCCSGRVFLALVPHPEDWDKGLVPEAFILARDGWVPCDAQTVRADGF
jgi:hypothetical protein